MPPDQPRHHFGHPQVPATFQVFRTDPAWPSTVGGAVGTGNWVDECQRSRYSRV